MQVNKPKDRLRMRLFTKNRLPLYFLKNFHNRNKYITVPTPITEFHNTVPIPDLELETKERKEKAWEWKEMG